MTKSKPDQSPWPGGEGCEFIYINSYYGLNIKRGTPVIYTDPKSKEVKKGVVAWDDGNAMIYILFEGEEKADGPYYPDRSLEYPGV